MDTIRSSREIDAVFSESRRVAQGPVTALIAKTPEGRGREGRVAFVAGKRLGGAVVRNRCKRVMREAVRAAGGPWPGWDVVLIASRRTASASGAELLASVARVGRATQGGEDR
jgi:ribonuclease P protein component